MKHDLEERLISYCVLILDIVEAMPDNKGANHLGNQIVRSGTAPSLMYGEAQSAESRRDFIHKMRLPLKELRETYNCLKIINRKNYAGVGNEKLIKALRESDELISNLLRVLRQQSEIQRLRPELKAKIEFRISNVQFRMSKASDTSEFDIRHSVLSF